MTSLNENLNLVSDLKPGDWVFLHGDLGAGKTYFTQKACEKMGVTEVVSSPTYALMNVYSFPSSRGDAMSSRGLTAGSSNFNGIEKILHLDLYRLKNPLEICSLGLEQEFDTTNTIAFFEWPSILQEQDWERFFEFTGCQRPLRIHNIHVSQHHTT